MEVGDETALVRIIKPEVVAMHNMKIISDNNGIVIADGETITAISDGTATVEVSATAQGKTVTASHNITVSPIDYGLTSVRTAADITLARIPDVIEVGEEFSAQAYILSKMTDEHPWAYAYYDDNIVSFTSDNPSVCRVKNGVLTGVSTGTATITAADITGTVKKTFVVSVVDETALEYTDDDIMTVNADDYDWTDAETTTLAIIDIIASAVESGKKKVVFPYDVYEVSPSYGTFTMPSHMILDFSGSVIQIVESALTQTGYQMFLFTNTEYSRLENAVIYAEGDLIDYTGAYGCESIAFSGYNYRSGLSNCTVSKSPGFNIGFGNKNVQRVAFKLSALEVGGIGVNGQNQDEPYAFRNNGYMDISRIGDYFGFGNMQGYQGYLYLSARVYSIYFYDAEQNYISNIENCIQYYRYSKPSNAVYARIKFYQGTAPTSCDPDYGGIAHVYSFDTQERCYIVNCHMEDNNATAIQPNAGESWLISDCIFRNNGFRDPASHIDWEDGRNNNKGHILRNCKFSGGGTVMATGADGLVIHNNEFDETRLYIGNEVQNSRVWLNTFKGGKNEIYTKTDMVFSQNYATDGAMFVIAEQGDGVDFAVRQAYNETVE